MYNHRSLTFSKEEQHPVTIKSSKIMYSESLTTLNGLKYNNFESNRIFGCKPVMEMTNKQMEGRKCEYLI